MEKTSLVLGWNEPNSSYLWQHLKPFDAFLRFPPRDLTIGGGGRANINCPWQSYQATPWLIWQLNCYQKKFLPRVSFYDIWAQYERQWLLSSVTLLSKMWSHTLDHALYQYFPRLLTSKKNNSVIEMLEIQWDWLFCFIMPCGTLCVQCLSNCCIQSTNLQLCL